MKPIRALLKMVERALGALVVLAVAWFAADITGDAIGGWAENQLRPATPTQMRAQLERSRSEAYPYEIESRNLFNAVLDAQPVRARCTLDAALHAALPVVNRPQASLAVVRDGGEMRVVRVGDSVGGAVLASVARAEVYWRQEGELCVQELQNVPSSVQVAVAPVVVSRGSHFVVDRARAQALVGDLPTLLTQAKVVPAWRSGKLIGYRLAWIASGSELAALGVQKDDVLVRVNGYGLTEDLYQITALGHRLESVSEITLDIERDGVPKSLRYVFQ